MKYFVTIIITVFLFNCHFINAQVTEDVIAYTEPLNFDNLAKHEEGKAILDKYPFLADYAPQQSSEASVQKRVLSRMPNIGLNYEFNKEAKTSYVPNQQNGWYYPDQKYYVGIYGKHYRKNKEKKGNRHLEQRIYRIEKMKAISHVDVLFDSPAWLEDIYNVRAMKNGEAVIVGSAVLFSDKEDDLKKRILFFDNEMNLVLDKLFESRQKKMFIYDILTNGDAYTVFNSSSSGFLKKGDGEAKYEVNVFSETASNTAMFDLNSKYYTIKRTQFEHMIKMNDGSTFMLGNLIYIDANQDSNPEKKGNLIYIHLDKDGKLLISESVPVKIHSEPYLFFYKESGDHVVFAFGNSTTDSSDMILQVNKNTGTISKEFVKRNSKGRYVYVDESNNQVVHCKKEPAEKKFVLSTILLK